MLKAFLVTLLFFGLALLGMAVGMLLGRPGLRGSCGRCGGCDACPERRAGP